MFRKSLHLLAGLATIATVGTLVTSPSYANPNARFECDATGILPKTVAVNRATGEAVPIIYWYSEFFGSDYDPLTRCSIVSQKFQKANESGSLEYITAGIVDNQPVICTPGLGGACSGSNVLFTLKPGTNAAVALQQLFDVRDLGGSGLFESSGRPYVNLKAKLDGITNENVRNQKPDAPASPANQGGNSERAF